MAKKLGLLTLLVVIVLAALNYKSIIDWIRPNKTVNDLEVKILLKEDPDVTTLLETLYGKKVIDDLDKAKEIANELGLDKKELAGGKYVILPGSRVEKVLNGFVKGENGRGKNEILVNVFFNSCRDLNDVAKNVSTCISADSTSLIDFMLAPETLSKYGFTAQQMPALILPKKYEMEFDTDAAEFVAFMAAQFRDFWTEERMQKLQTIGLKSPSQAVTLASIVYSEQGKVHEEWPVIAKLYLNRIDQGMKLQSDPTFKFCWGHKLDGMQRLTAKHREINCDYNTYQIQGLPPGPICVTPSVVVDAVLNPAKVNYLFMCAKPDFSGQHNFTRSGQQHIKNANIYQKWLAEQL